MVGFLIMAAAEEAKHYISQTLVAALLVRPLDPGLTRQELEKILVGRGIASPVVADVMNRTWWDLAKDSEDRAIADVMTMMVARRWLSPTIFPQNTLKSVEQAVKAWVNEQGSERPIALRLLSSRCPNQSAEHVELAVGVAVAMTQLKLKGDGYARGTYAWNWNEPRMNDSSEWDDSVRRLIDVVASAFALRAGTTVPSTPPVDRFHLFLQKQGWIPFAQWWAITSREMEEAGERYPTASTVLAGALLEAALVAIAEPAKAANEWRHKFLGKEPAKWNFGELIDQAKVAGTFSAADAYMASKMAEMRNRIHAGRFAELGKPPTPPHLNPQQATIARTNLDHLLDVILDWTFTKCPSIAT
jgi:hypothetical protein